MALPNNLQKAGVAYGAQQQLKKRPIGSMFDPNYARLLQRANPGGVGANTPNYTPPASPLNTGVEPVDPASPAANELQADPSDPRVDSIYNSTIGRLRQQREDTYTQLGYQDRRTANDYGFKVDFHGHTADAIPEFDPTNPFSKMALLQRSFEQTKNGDNTGFAANGQLFSGAYGRQREETQHGFDVNKDSLVKAFQDAINGSNQQRFAAEQAYGNGESDAGKDRLRLLFGG